MSKIDLRLFGPPRLFVDGSEVHFNQRKPLALLAYLAMTRRTHTRAALATLFWPDYAGARDYLRNAISLLRQGLGANWDEFVQFDRDAVRWRSHGAATVDVLTFEEALAAWQAHDHPFGALCPACHHGLESAVDLYRDDFLAGFTLNDSADFDDWCVVQQEHLRRSLLEALDALSDFHTTHNEFAQAMILARRRLQFDPLDEVAHRRLMALHHIQGQRAQAARQYEECVQILNRELAIPPAPETDALFHEIMEGQPPRGDVAQAPPLPVVPAKPESVGPPSNIPAPVMALVGRTEEIAQVTQLLTSPETRLVTLTGPGGMGKTRLAIEVVRTLAPTYADGAFFVDLAPLRDPTALAAHIAHALHIDVSASPTSEDALYTALTEHRLLLVLDNFEHLPTAAPLVTRLLLHAPGLKVLATSRERLRLGGEHEYVVPPLAVPDAVDAARVHPDEAGSAVELFRRHAVAAQHHFSLTPETIPLVVRICTRLDGLPLAIELAAARIRYHTLASLVERLDASLVDAEGRRAQREVLTSDRRDVEARQESLHAAIDWSYQLLTTDEQALLRRLAVFVAGWTLESGAAVFGAGGADRVQRLIHALLDKHLIRHAGSAAEVQRFTMLETVRVFAFAKLVEAGEVAATEAAMTRYYLDLAEQLEQGIESARFSALQQLIEAERPNVRWVIQRAEERRDVSVLLRMCGGAFLRWTTSPREVAALTAQILTIAEGADPSEDYAAALTAGGYWAWVAGEYQRARPWMQAALQMYEMPTVATDSFRAGLSRGILGVIAFERGDFMRSLAWFEEDVTLHRAEGGRWELAVTLANLGYLLSRLGRNEEAEAAINEALALQLEVGQQWGLAHALGMSIDHHLRQGNTAAAESVLRELELILADDLLPDRSANYAYNRSRLALLCEDTEAAARYAARNLQILQRLGTRDTQLLGLQLTANVALVLGAPEDCLTLLGALDAAFTAWGMVLPPAEADEVMQMRFAASMQIDDETTATRAWERGRQLSVQQAIAFALADVLPREGDEGPS